MSADRYENVDAYFMTGENHEVELRVYTFSDYKQYLIKSGIAIFQLGQEEFDLLRQLVREYDNEESNV